MTLPVSGGVPEQGLREVRMYLDTIKEIIEAVDERAMAADGPVTPTLKEMTQAEMTEIYESAVDGSNRANEFLAAALERPRPARPELQDEDVYRLNETIWRDNPAESIAEAKRRSGPALPAPEPPHHREISLSVEAFIEKREENGAEIPEKVAALLFDLGTHLCGAAEHAPPDLTRLREQYANYKNRPRDNAMRDAVDYMFLCDKLMAFIDDHWGSRPALAGSPDENALALATAFKAGLETGEPESLAEARVWIRALIDVIERAGRVSGTQEGTTK